VKRKLLWIGDAVVSTGFARVTHHVLDVLKETWDVGVLGLNYLGDPHNYPYPVFPCWPGGDWFGVGRTAKVVNDFKPDVVVIQNDPWNIPAYLKEILDKESNWKCPIVGALAVDGKNCRANEYRLNELAMAIFWTKFGVEEAINGGLTPTKAAIIPLGVDLDLYKPIPKLEARKFLGLPEHMMNGFIVGNLNRNQPRKRLDLTIEAFAKWIRDCRIQDAYLFLQLCPTGDMGYDVKQLKQYYDPEGRGWLIVVEPEIGFGVNESLLPYVYSAFDVQLTTTLGEGWGLTTMEGMACGVPQIVPDWSALGEWTRDAVVKVKCATTQVTPNKVNVVGGVVNVFNVVSALDMLYNSKEKREELSQRGMKLVSHPSFRWPEIGRYYTEALDMVVPGKKEDAA
jgi:glycosyltransferase involved in cell wall biosynthesis